MKLRKRWWAFIIGFLLLVLGIFFDKQVSLFAVSLRLPLLNSFMVWVSYFGTGFFVLVLMTSLFLWQERKRDYIVPLWASVILSLAAVGILKFLFFRMRPFDLLGFENLIYASGSSFPSGHAAAVFSTLAILDKEFPRFKIFWLAFACLVGFSRIYTGVHYFSDVVFSALLGLSIGLLILKNKKWFDFEKKRGLFVRNRFNTLG